MPLALAATRRRVATVLGLMLAPLTAAAQQPPTVLPLADGRTIHVFGLRRWTVGMIQDSLGKYSPGDSLQSHACAAALRYKLGFADASATTLRMGPGRPDMVFVSVREPQDSARVHYRTMPIDTANPRAAWLPVTKTIAGQPAAFRAGVALFLSPDEAGRFRKAEDSVTAVSVAAFLRARTKPGDHQAALRAIGESPNHRDRMVAALILVNFPDRDGTWPALLDAVRESDGPVKSVAGQALAVVAQRSQTPPDWARLSPGLHAILDGTSLFLIDDVIELLNGRPEIAPRHAPALLRGGGEMLLNHLASTQPFLSTPAHTLLVKLRGADLGRDPAAWRTWIDGL